MILVAENEAVNQVVTKHQLGLLGYEAEVVCDGQEVLDALQRRRYPLILMDCHMPILDGWQTTIRIHEQKLGDVRTPIIALTANLTAEFREQCLQAAMDDFVSKPVHLEHRKTVLAKFLERV